VRLLRVPKLLRIRRLRPYLGRLDERFPGLLATVKITAVSPQPRARLPLRAGVHRHVPNDSYGRVYRCARSVETGALMADSPAARSR
jgi:hypothetical protein